MNNIISNYMNNFSMDDVKGFAIQNGVYLSDEELVFVYHFVKENYLYILKNPNSLVLAKYKDKFSKNNYDKIVLLLDFYKRKYGFLLSKLN